MFGTLVDITNMAAGWWGSIANCKCKSYRILSAMLVQHITLYFYEFYDPHKQLKKRGWIYTEFIVL